jgi:hypothetical protein
MPYLLRGALFLLKTSEVLFALRRYYDYDKVNTLILLRGESIVNMEDLW